MYNISNLLKTPKGAKVLKAKLKTISENEKSKADYKKILQMICVKVNEYSLQKVKQNN